MSAYEDYLALLRDTEIMKGFMQSLEEEPLKLLGKICEEYRKTNESVPDHHLHFPGYIGDTAIKALESAGLIKIKPGGKLYGYFGLRFKFLNQS